MWRAVKGQSELEAKLQSLLHPGPTSQEERRYRSLERASKRRYARLKARQEHARQEWIAKLRGNIDRIRSVNEATVNQVFGDLFYLGQEIAEPSNSSSRWKWNRWDLLDAEFGREVAEAARDGLMDYWRLFKPGLRSDQDAKGLSNGASVGLIGLVIEVREHPNWTRNLEDQEVRHACRYMLCEPNGLPDWATDIMNAHPETFDIVMRRELSWQFEQPADLPEPLYVVSALHHGPEPICERYCSIIYSLLEQMEPAPAGTLENALSLLLRWNDLDQSAFTNLARQRYETSQDEGRRLTWLVARLCVEADGALDALCAWLDDAEDTGEATRRMIAFCNALLEYREMRFDTPRRDFERIDILRRFVPLIYRYVRIEEDNIHEDAYSPDARDHAETTRSYLLGRVCETSGRATFETLMAFSQELPHQRFRQRMVILARRRAAEDAEQAAWLATDVLSFAERAERAPRSARDLFDLVCSRLDDLRLDLEEGDASEARILRRVDQETEIRTWFANRLRQAARGRYSAPPEEELADVTRPDLRIHAPALDAPISIELKIADNWSYSQLLERLRNQLVGQYLRDIRSTFGIFLLVWRGEQRHWRNPEVGKVTFGELLKRLHTPSSAHATTSDAASDPGGRRALPCRGIAWPSRPPSSRRSGV
jgi:hypothetical protein